MKSCFFFLTFISFCSLHTGYGEELAGYEEDNAMLEIEKELLSLEDELLQTEQIVVVDEAISNEQIVSTPELVVEQVGAQDVENVSSVSLTEDIIPAPTESKLSSFADTQENPTDQTIFENINIEEAPSILDASLEESFESVLPTSNPSKETSSSIPALIPIATTPSSIQISFAQVFQGSPYIYSSLVALSLFAITLALYTLLRLRQDNFNPSTVSKEIKNRLLSHNFSGAMDFCQNSPNFLCQMVASGLVCRKQGTHAIIANMQSEGKRITVSSWQRLNLLQDVAIVAPMLGLLGTILGLFYAFYDLNRSVNSMNNLLDGLGISVGTTVAGIVVAILAMILHSTAKFRLVRSLVKIESEATALAHLMEETHR